MSRLLQKGIKLLRLKLKFAGTSSIATAVDYSIYAALTYFLGFTQQMAHLCSATVGMIVNFFLQKRFVFDLKRKTSTAFLLAITVSIGGIFLGLFIIDQLNQYSFFASNPIASKIGATGIVFFYNFYFKRYVFEKRVFETD